MKQELFVYQKEPANLDEAGKAALSFETFQAGRSKDVATVRMQQSENSSSEVPSWARDWFSKVERQLNNWTKQSGRATEANREFHWSAECQEAFDELKKALTTPPILAYPSEDGLFWLDTDASGSGVGAILSQEQDEEKRVISYYSRVLTGNERNYCVTRRELLAVVMAVKHFPHYLWGRHFVVRSDHGSLRWLMNLKNPEGQLWRWLQTLSEYDYEIQYRPGAQHRNADGLSRRPCHECRHCERQEAKDEVKDIGCPGHKIRAMDFEGGNTSEGWIQPWSNEQLRTWQREDTVLAKVKRWVEDGTKLRFKDVQMESTSLRSFWFHFEQLECIDGILYRKVTSGSWSFHRLVCPKVIQEQIFDFLHTKRTGGHLGINRTSSSAHKTILVARDEERCCPLV